MNTTIQIYKHEQLGSIRCWKNENGEIVMLANDVAKGLGYSSASAMTRTLDDDEKGMQIVHTPGGKQEMLIITESGFYHAALKARVEKAKMFRKWVTSVVLPQIRKTGGYINVDVDDDDNVILAKALIVAQRTIELKNLQLEEQKPKVVFANAITSCDDTILIRDLAKLISQNGVNIGQNRLFKWLRKQGFLFKNDTRPFQRWVESGLFELNTTLVETNHGIIERFTTKVTGKGQAYFINGFLTGRFHAENGQS